MKTRTTKQSGHYFTRARIIAAALAAPDPATAMALWARVEQPRSQVPTFNQKKKRKQRRQLYAAGVSSAFAR
jgi:hypothetical protein